MFVCMYVFVVPKAEIDKSQFWSVQVCVQLVKLVQQSSRETQLIGTLAYPSKFPVIYDTIDCVNKFIETCYYLIYEVEKLECKKIKK